MQDFTKQGSLRASDVARMTATRVPLSRTAVASLRRIVPIVTCDKCGAARLDGGVCWPCARLVNIELAVAGVRSGREVTRKGLTAARSDARRLPANAPHRHYSAWRPTTTPGTSKGTSRGLGGLRARCALNRRPHRSTSIAGASAHADAIPAVGPASAPSHPAARSPHARGELRAGAILSPHCGAAGRFRGVGRFD
jgi:hypothetical protein